MASGRRRSSHPGELFLTSADLPPSPAHASYDRVNERLAGADFDRLVGHLCRPRCGHELGRPPPPPGAYFRMLLVGYSEGIGSRRGIAWRWADSFSPRASLAIPPAEASPDRSSLAKIRKRLPAVAHERVFARVLAIAREKGLLKGKVVGAGSTPPEANAAMRAIALAGAGEDYKACPKRRAKAAGTANPTGEELVRSGRHRKDKSASNAERVAATDADSRVAEMKDGRTRPAYKAEHAVDLGSRLILAAGIHPADAGGTAALAGGRLRTQANLVPAGLGIDAEEAAADKGYHKAETPAECREWGWRACIPGQRRKKRTWTGKPESWRVATGANRRRVEGERCGRAARAAWGRRAVCALVLWRWNILGRWVRRWYGQRARGTNDRFIGNLRAQNLPKSGFFDGLLILLR